MVENVEFIEKIINSSESLKTLALEPIEIVSSRRGAIVARVSSSKDGAQYALKVSIESEENAYSQNTSIKHESNTLQALAEESDNLYVDSHSSDDGTWLLIRWFGSLSSTDVAKTLRNDGLDKQKNKLGFINLALMLANKVEVCHKNGYLHGDLQPSHFIINGDRAILIDWAIAQKIDGDTLKYKGAFVHYAAPEIASEMLERSGDIDYDVKAEIYAFGAVLFYLYTGKTAVFYGDEDFGNVPFEDKLKYVSDGHLRSFNSSQAPDHPELEEILMKCLATDKSERYNDVSEIKNDLLNFAASLSKQIGPPLFAELISELEKRETKLSEAEIAQNKHHLTLGRAVGAFEDVDITPEIKKLSELVAEGRVRTKEAAELALRYA